VIDRVRSFRKAVLLQADGDVIGGVVQLADDPVIGRRLRLQVNDLVLIANLRLDETSDIPQLITEVTSSNDGTLVESLMLSWRAASDDAHAGGVRAKF